MARELELEQVGVVSGPHQHRLLLERDPLLVAGQLVRLRDHRAFAEQAGQRRDWQWCRGK